LEEEQEREVNYEIEAEHEVQRPPKATAAKHQVHAHVHMLIETGRIPTNSSQFVSIFYPIGQAVAASRDGNWLPNLLATRDFSTTIEGLAPCVDTEYLRPVNWIISSNSDSIFVALSPYEVNELLPKIRTSKKVHLHQYAPRVTQSMKSFERLDFYCIPPLPSRWIGPTLDLRVQFNLWSGQLYLADREMYRRLCNLLGLTTQGSSPDDDTLVQNDGFIKSGPHRNDSCPFTESPVPFLKKFIGLRRKGMGYMSTHVGKILHARLLTDEDFD
jgi:hypothetical protein